MRFPWERYNFVGHGTMMSYASIVDLCKKQWPDHHLDLKGGGDQYYFLPRKEQRDLFRELAFEDIDVEYHEDLPEDQKGVFQCEEFSRARLCQADLWVRHWTDLGVPMAFFSMRAVQVGAKGHDLNLLAWEKAPSIQALEIWQPYNGQDEKPLSFVTAPWLLYA